MTNHTHLDMSVSFCGVRFPNPFLLSSSPVSNSAEMVEKAFAEGWGGVCYKTLNSDRIPIIHPSPRMNAYHYESKRLVGLQNVEQISDRPLKDNLADFLYSQKEVPRSPDHRQYHGILQRRVGLPRQGPRPTTGRTCWSSTSPVRI